MSFGINVVENVPISEHAELNGALKLFLSQIGYISRDKDSDIAIELFKCFLIMPKKSWTIDELVSHLNTSRPTLYYHLNKLKVMDLIEGKSVKIEGFAQKKKVYRLRFKDLERAWHFVEYHIEDNLKNYRKTVKSIWSMAKREHERLLLD